MNQATEPIQSEHPQVEDLFARFDETRGPDTTAVVDATYASSSAPDGFVAGPVPDGFVAGPVPDGATKEELLDLTKDELYEKAKAADISGRSSMNKEELAEELASR